MAKKKAKSILVVFLLAALIGNGIPDTEVSAYAANSSSTTTKKEATAKYEKSGLKSKKKLTVKQLVQLYDSIADYGSSLYKIKPVLEIGNYNIGRLTPKAYKSAKNTINFYRVNAGLGKITFTDELNESAAYGALVDAAYGKLTHYPYRPYDMSYYVYNKGYAATTTSNLSYSKRYPVNQVIDIAVACQMADSSGSNVTNLGHRRWLLYPNIKTMGIGIANPNDEEYYTDIKVVGDGVTNANVTNYKFISWPASGNNLSELFDTSNPWSVTLNPKVFTIPTSTKGLKVTITQKSNGKKWVFTEKTNDCVVSVQHSFFKVDNDGYGEKNCIIFRPAYSKLESYKGEYVVKITGLKDIKRKKKRYSYKVNIVSYEDVKLKMTKPEIDDIVSTEEGCFVTWRGLENIDGYQISYGQSFDMSDATKTSTKKTYKNIIDLENDIVYYVKLRAYRKNSRGKKVYSQWSDEMLTIN